MPHVETARKGPVGRHEQRYPVARETAAAHGATASGHARHGMEVTGNLTLGAGWLVAKNQRADRERTAKAAADTVGRVGVVISGDPDPIAPTLQPRERRAIGGPDAGGALAVMKAVAERYHQTWSKACNYECYSRQGRCGIIRRQQHATHGKAGTFLQMQIGDDENTLLGPIQRAIAMHRDRHISNGNFCCRCLLPGSRRSTGNRMCVQRATPMITALPPSRV